MELMEEIKKLAKQYGIEEEDFLNGLEDAITKHDVTFRNLAKRKSEKDEKELERKNSEQS